MCLTLFKMYVSRLNVKGDISVRAKKPPLSISYRICVRLTPFVKHTGY